MGRILAFLMIALMAFAFFGGKRLPELARGLARSLRILRSESAAPRGGGTERPAAGPVASGGTVRTIQAAPGDTSTARPVTEHGSGGPR
ncbi:twin-arginine translocase TatA/TatE family subunit [Kitasatospora sp. NPDC052896]|uniref:twin-arginine translocase TatA/TatE family subunit n=1 Tax=Kitasatospora sp. NPDC052896 TaxID=3364061 RepID=UPI0037C5C5FD